MKFAARRELSFIVASFAVAALSLRATLKKTQARKTIAATFQPVSVATCHDVRAIAAPKARTPAANATSTRVSAETCDSLMLPSSLLAALLANAPPPYAR
jgi:hypothetical protein